MFLIFLEINYFIKVEYIVKKKYIKEVNMMILGFLVAQVMRYMMKNFPISEFLKFIIGFILLAIILIIILLFKVKKSK